VESPPSPYALYTAVLSHLAADSTWYHPILLDPRTHSFEGRDSALMVWSGSFEVSRRASAAFRRVNERTKVLSDSFAIPPPAGLLDPSARHLLDIGTTLWPSIREKYGNHVAILRFSLPGVDPIDGEALLYYTYQCGPSPCGGGRYARLRWKGDAWVVDADTVAWLS
jgi:hypothetical protein